MPNSPDIDPTNPAAERSAVAAALTAWYALARSSQVRDGSANDGGWMNNGWCAGRDAAFRLARLIAIRIWAAECRVSVAETDDAIRRAARFIAARQHPGGELDLGGFYSPNEAGFTLPGLCAGYKRLAALGGNPLGDVCATLESFIKKAADAVVNGSAYTANHRWAAACAPLACANALWPDSKYMAKIESYLADGIDCNEDGCWYEERSPNYNTVANYGMFSMADALGRDDLLEHVKRSLNFTLYSIQPNGEMDSSISHRQDRGQPDRLASDYSVARRVALLTGDGRCTTLAREMWRRGGGLSGDLVPLPFWIDDFPGPLPSPELLPTRYERRYISTGIARVRDDDRALTLACDRGGHFYDVVRDGYGGPKRSEDWLHLHAGNIVVQTIRLAGAGMTYIMPDRLDDVGKGSWHLSGFVEKWVFPVHFRPGSPPLDFRWDWSHEIDVALSGDELRVQLRSDAPKALRAELWLWIRPGVALTESDSPEIKLAAGKRIALKGGGPLRLESQTHRLEIIGLPSAQHSVPMLPTEAIPSSIMTDCCGLFLGLLFPVDVDLVFRHSRITQ